MTLINELVKYPYSEEAKALFFKSVLDRPSFRFEITALGWEFSDGFYVGKDPKGTFYYSQHFADLSKIGITRGHYLIKQHREPSDLGTIYVHIKFTTMDGKVLGEFLAKDDKSVAGSSGLLNQIKVGEWKQISCIDATGSAAKHSGTSTITIQSVGLHKKATFECGEHDRIKHEKIAVDGTLTLHDVETVESAKYVRWYEDHAVFYESTNSHDYSAFFFAEEGHNNPLGSDNDKEWSGVHWEHI